MSPMKFQEPLPQCGQVTAGRSLRSSHVAQAARTASAPGRGHLLQHGSRQSARPRSANPLVRSSTWPLVELASTNIVQLAMNESTGGPRPKGVRPFERRPHDHSRPGPAARGPHPVATKAWTLVVLLSLALGIGANTALFTAVNGLLLQTVSVREPRAACPVQPCRPEQHGPELERLRLLGDVRDADRPVHVLVPMIEELRAANTTLTGLAAGVPMGSLNVLLTLTPSWRPAIRLPATTSP